MSKLWWTSTLALVVMSCGEVRDFQNGGEYAPFLELDSELSANEVELIQSSTTFLAMRTIDGARIPWFQEVFGGADSSALIQFLAERVKYIVSEKTEIQDRVRVGAHLLGLDSEDPRSGIGATNLSSLWFFQKSLPSDHLFFEINNRFVEVSSTRVGIVQLGPALSRVPQLIQAGVLLHEARHSDCTGGVWRSDIDRLMQGEDPKNVSCGHLHVVCPSEHEFAGLYACDSEPWGAYSMNLLYSLAVHRTCKNCSEQELVVALAASIDAASRLLFNAERMLAGDYGPPNMSTSQEVLGE